MCRLSILFFFCAFFACPLNAQTYYTSEDSVIFEHYLKYSQQGDHSVIRTARFFMDTPYVSGTLEGDSVEQLRVNLRELDCVTFVENILALYLMTQSSDHSFGNFCRTLQRIRYRDSFPDGYLSRLHYTSEWLDNNRRKGIIDLPKLPGCQDFVPGVSFMSTHCDAYPALKAHPAWCQQMDAIEKQINTLTLCYFPKEQLKTWENNIQTGDIISITTHIKGLDVAHMGFALVQDGIVYLLHASSEAKKVIVSSETLSDYLARRKNHSGIIVTRVMNDK